MLIDDLAKSYEKHRQKWMDNINVTLSAYIDTYIDRENLIGGKKLVFGMGTGILIDYLGYSHNISDELEELLEIVNQLVSFSDPFPFEYVGKYRE